jgi:hypothetical protein
MQYYSRVLIHDFCHLQGQKTTLAGRARIGPTIRAKGHQIYDNRDRMHAHLCLLSTS